VSGWGGWGEAAGARARVVWLADFHLLDKAILDGIDVMDCLVDEEISRHIADHLMDLDVCLAGFVLVDADGFDVGIQHVPLASPVLPHILASVDSSAFHAVGPVDQRMQVGEYGVYLTRIEGFVGGVEQFFVRFHAVCRLVE